MHGKILNNSMLKHLYIKSFTLIDELDIELHPGFSVITGETGAGKSIILGAISLLLGQRADPKSIKQGADRCIIEAHFELSRYDMHDFFEENDIDYDENDCIIRRELTSNGKSRAFINDTPVQLSMMKELGDRLVDIHSQHQNLLINKQDFQLNVVDIIADDAQELESYRQTFSQYQDTKKALETLIEEIERNRQNLDFIQFQCNELAQANLAADEQEELEQRSETMSHSEDIKSALFEADNVLSSEDSGAVDAVRTAMMSLRSIERVLPAAPELVQRIDSCYIELKDLAQEINNLLDSIDFDPAELDAINSRLDKLYDLEKKYQVDTVGELIDKHEELKRKLNEIETGDDVLKDLQDKVDHLKSQAKAIADKLTKQRKKAASKIEKEMQERLVQLGMPNVRFNIQVSEEALSQKGQDAIAFLFSANASTPLQPISQVASGGEVARVMLSLKAMISGAVKLPTIIFDEIDTGVSGKMAEKMAEIMKEMGQHERQVISITHLPQIAALGTAHYKVEKEETAGGTISRLVELSSEERITEIAQMLSGSEVSEAAVQNAKQLLRL